MNARTLQRRRVGGFAMVETLVALLLLSFGLLAMAALLTQAVQLGKVAGQRGVAMMAATDLIERIRANPAGYTAGNYGTATFDGSTAVPAVSRNCTGIACNAADLAELDRQRVLRMLRARVNAGGFVVERLDDTNGVVRMYWVEPRTVASLDASQVDECGSNSVSAPQGSVLRCLRVRFQLT